MSIYLADIALISFLGKIIKHTRLKTFGVIVEQKAGLLF
jgi:hypothetical protein